jgi:hypothetical protein
MPLREFHFECVIWRMMIMIMMMSRGCGKRNQMVGHPRRIRMMIVVVVVPYNTRRQNEVKSGPQNKQLPHPRGSNKWLCKTFFFSSVYSFYWTMTLLLHAVIVVRCGCG